MNTLSIITPLYKGKKYIPDLIKTIAKCVESASEIATVEWIISNDDPDEEIGEVDKDIGFTIKILQIMEFKVPG